MRDNLESRNLRLNRHPFPAFCLPFSVVRPPSAVLGIPGFSASGGGSLLLDAGFELGIHLQYVFPDPGPNGLMQVPEQFHSIAQIIANVMLIRVDS